MHPVLFNIGKFELPAYGALLVLAFLVATYFLKKEASRMGIDPQKTVDAALIALLFGLLGAKILLILVDAKLYFSNPSLMLGTLQSAGVVYGGIIGGAVAVVVYIRKRKMPLWTTLDTMVPFLALGIGLGRLSCLMAGCCYGIRYDGPLALHFPDHPRCEAPPDIGLFPVQILSLLNGVVLCLVLVALLRKRAFEGQVLAAFFFLYSLTRGAIEFLRGDTVRGLWLGDSISTSQLIAVFGALFGIFLYLKKKKDALR